MPAEEFKIIADIDNVEEIPRDLSFHPTTNTSPSSLAADQIEHYNEVGFVAPLDVFDSSEIEQIRAYFDGLLEQTVSAGGDSYSISTAHRRHGRVYDLIHDSRIVDPVADLLGENVIGWGSHFFCKMPGDGKRVAWHQDASYWPMTPSRTATVWLAIDDADVENACMRFIPGSHALGHLTYRLSEDDEDNVLNQTVDNAEQFGQPVDDVLWAGQISIHSDLLLHGSEANTSSRRRCGLTLRYCAAEVRAHMGWHDKGTWVRGTDPTGHWANAPRPAQD